MSDAVLERTGASTFGFERIDARTGKKRRNLAVVRGNGTLTLTGNELRFARAVPPEDVRIPLELIEWTNVARTHNGKSFGFLPVLQVAFRTHTDTQILGVCVGRRDETEQWRAEIDRRVATLRRPEHLAGRDRRPVR